MGLSIFYLKLTRNDDFSQAKRQAIPPAVVSEIYLF